MDPPCGWKTVLILISWLHQKPADLDRHSVVFIRYYIVINKKYAHGVLIRSYTVLIDYNV